MSRIYWLPTSVGAILLGAVAPAFAQQAVAPSAGAQVREQIRENAEQRRENAEVRRENAERRREAVEQNREHAQAGHRIENMDQFMVAWLAPCKEEEIILAKMAQGRAQNPQVKQFADQMIADHTAFLQKLGKFGHVEKTFDTTADANATKPATVPATPPADEGVVRNTLREVGESAREVARDVGDAVRSTVGYTDSADACRMKREIHRECLSLTERELDRWQGAEFDQAYLGQQAGAHIGMLATLKTFEKHASNEMRPVIEQARATTEKHLNHANELMQKLGHPSTARRATEPVDTQK